MAPAMLEHREWQRGRKIEVGSRRGPQNHHRLIYNAGGNRIHDQNPAFRGIDESPQPMHRVVAALIFSSEPVLFPRQPSPSTVKICQKISSDMEIIDIIEFCKLNCSIKLCHKYVGSFNFYIHGSYINSYNEMLKYVLLLR